MPPFQEDEEWKDFASGEQDLSGLKIQTTLEWVGRGGAPWPVGVVQPLWSVCVCVCVCVFAHVTYVHVTCVHPFTLGKMLLILASRYKRQVVTMTTVTMKVRLMRLYGKWLFCTSRERGETLGEILTIMLGLLEAKIRDCC